MLNNGKNKLWGNHKIEYYSAMRRNTRNYNSQIQCCIKAADQKNTPGMF